MIRNVLITLCYDGSGYHGWQVQQNAVSVQQVFQEALYKILSERPSLKGCSRTDTGVHAKQFCISMQLESAIPCKRLQGALNHFCRRIWRCWIAGKYLWNFMPDIPAQGRNMCIPFGIIRYAPLFAGPGSPLLVFAGY